MTNIFVKWSINVLFSFELGVLNENPVRLIHTLLFAVIYERALSVLSFTYHPGT